MTTTFKRLTIVFFWKGMQRQVRQFIKECDLFQRYKYKKMLLLDYSNLFLSLSLHGPRSVWISLKGYLFQVARMSSLWWWIG